MIKIIIADDDFNAREGLSRLIDWGKLGAEVVCAVSDGTEAVKALEQEAVDLVITDIKMPAMDGIELAQYIHRHMPQTQILFLSAYADFEYAQEAMHVGVRGYILKPISRDKIVKLSNMVRDIAAEIEDAKRITDSISDNRSLYRQTVHIIEKGDMAALDELLEVSEQFRKFELYREFCNRIIDCLVQSNFPYLPHIRESKGAGLYRGMQQCSSVAALKQYTRQLCVEAIHQRQESAENRSARLVTQIEHYVKERFCDPELTVQRVADEFDLSADYLSRNFKSQRNILLSEWIIKLRIDKAKELLAGSDLTVEEIAGRCGYISSRYFFKLFKSKTGITPSQYRQKAGRDYEN